MKKSLFLICAAVLSLGASAQVAESTSSFEYTPSSDDSNSNPHAFASRLDAKREAKAYLSLKNSSQCPQ